jgi:hypothetical protein
MIDVDAIDSHIAELKKQLLRDDLGTECEVYTRIVGYYVEKHHANKGKQQEFTIRKNFIYKNSS